MSLRRPVRETQSDSNTIPGDKMSTVKARMHGGRRLCFYHEIPPWQQDNEFILSGYRPTSGSAYISLASILYMHNQSINIYTHLLGSVAFFSLPLYFSNFLPTSNGTNTDLVVVSIYSIGVAVCFAFSATFHIMWNHSHAVTSVCNRLDYLGILILMWGAGIPTIYYGFICNSSLQLLYWTMTTVSAAGCAFVTMNPLFITPQYRPWRASFYAGFGLSSIIFVLHGLYLHGWETQNARMSLTYMGWMAFSNLTGACIYAARGPEKWFPYTFDYYGASHQILHVSVMVAAVIHFYGLIQSFTLIRSVPQCT